MPVSSSGKTCVGAEQLIRPRTTVLALSKATIQNRNGTLLVDPSDAPTVDLSLGTVRCQQTSVTSLISDCAPKVHFFLPVRCGCTECQQQARALECSPISSRSAARRQPRPFASPLEARVPQVPI